MAGGRGNLVFFGEVATAGQCQRNECFITHIELPTSATFYLENFVHEHFNYIPAVYKKKKRLTRDTIVNSGPEWIFGLLVNRPDNEGAMIIMVNMSHLLIPSNCS